MDHGRPRSHPGDRTAAAVREDSHHHHHHHLALGELSREAEDVDYTHFLNDAHNTLTRHTWPVIKHDQPPLVTVPTDREPLIRLPASSTTTPTVNIQPSYSSKTTFTERYGRCLDIIHYGTNSTVRLHECKAAPSYRSKQVVAIKVYRYSIIGSDTPNATHAAPSSIYNAHPHHPNILPILDLLHNERGELCLVMPYCAGGDLRTLLSHNGHSPLETPEADCIIKQILRGLACLHENGIAHRDIQLETILLTSCGAVKLAGFSDDYVRRLWAECSIPTELESNQSQHTSETPHPHSSAPFPFSLFAQPWLLFRRNPASSSKGPKLISNISTVSSPGLDLPYIPPEVFHGYHHHRHHIPLQREGSRPSTSEDEEDISDARPADIWATAIIYMALFTGHLLWNSVRPHHEDGRYLEYLRCRSDEDGYPPIEALGSRRRNAIYAMLHPMAHKRITAKAMLQSEWISNVQVCEAGERGYF